MTTRKLIPYSLTPQSCALEYEEQRDLAEHPEKAEHYIALIKARSARYRITEKGK